MVKGRVRCNSCGVKGCNNYDNLNFAKGCKLFVEMDEMKTPMLIHLMTERKVNSTKKVLEKFDMKIVETGRYPYFRLEY